jgi:hypothetical protein
MRVGKGFMGSINPAKTTPTSIASGLAQSPSRARLDNRKRMAVAKPSSRPITTHHLGRHGMTARAGSFT